MSRKQMAKGTEEVHRQARFGMMAVDWQSRIDFTKLRTERLARAQARMKKEGIATLLVTMAENKRYVSGCRSSTGTGGSEESFALVFADRPDLSDVIVYENGSCWLADREHVTWLRPGNHRPIGSIWARSRGPAFEQHHAAETAQMFKRDLEEHGVSKEKVAIDAASGALRAALEGAGIKLVEGFRLMQEIRSIKTPQEIECLRMAGAVADIGWGAVMDSLKPGMRGTHLRAIIMERMIREAFLDEVPPGCTIRTGPETAPHYIMRTPTDRIIQPGDLVYLDIAGIAYNGYRSCYYRTFKVGTRPTQQEKDWYKSCRDMLYQAISVFRDGVTTADVAEKYPPYTYWKIPSEACAVGNAMGHGIGLNQFDLPFISRENSLQFPQPISKGMVIAMETWDGQSDIEHGWRGGCRVENAYLITEDGYENLYSMPDDEILCPLAARYY